MALDQLFDRWLSATFVDIRRNRLVLLQEADGNRVAVLDRIRAVVRDHCVDPNVTAKRLTELGARWKYGPMFRLIPYWKRLYANRRFSLHHYFIAKSLDRVRPGGLLALVTVHHTLDKGRDAMRAHVSNSLASWILIWRAMLISHCSD